MAGKKVSIKKKPTAAQADGWVEERKMEILGEEKSENLPKMRRFTIDISEQLHRKIKAKAAIEGVTMAKMLRHILEKEFM